MMADIDTLVAMIAPVANLLLGDGTLYHNEIEHLWADGNRTANERKETCE
jgi:hypothetical protein